MSSVTKKQIRAIHATIKAKGLQDQKKDIILNASEGRTESSSDLTYEEAHTLLKFLNTENKNNQSTDRMIRKLMAMAYDLRWIESFTFVRDHKTFKRNDFSKVYEWVRKYGYLGKELKEYSYQELPKLLSQFEKGPYAHFLKK